MRRERWVGKMIEEGVLLNEMDVEDGLLESILSLQFPQTIYPYNPTQYPSRTNNQHTHSYKKKLLKKWVPTFSGIVMVL